MISLTLFASFELGPTLGDGEVVRKFESTIGDLLDHNSRLQREWYLFCFLWALKHSRIAIDPEQRDENITSLGSSFEIVIKQRVCDRNECVLALNVSGLCCYR